MASRRLDSLDAYSGRELLRAAAAKLRRRARKGLRARAMSPYAQAVEVNVPLLGVDVAGRTDLSGGGIGYVAGYLRALLHVGGAIPCKRTFEFCAGPGYIGYALLGAGCCERLTLADVNPESVELARRTARDNGIESLVDVFVSDALEEIPAHEPWDLVVGNPPHFLRERPPSAMPDGIDTNSIIYFDDDWNVHRKFYAKVKGFMRPGGLVVMLEDRDGSTVQDFAAMIADGGGELIDCFDDVTLQGERTANYFVVSRW